MKKLPPQTVRIVVWLLFAVGAIVAILGVLVKITPLSEVGIVVLICGVGCQFLLYRCPHCGRLLDGSVKNFSQIGMQAPA